MCARATAHALPTSRCRQDLPPTVEANRQAVLTFRRACPPSTRKRPVGDIAGFVAGALKRTCQHNSYKS